MTVTAIRVAAGPRRDREIPLRPGSATYTVSEVAELLGVGTSTVYQMLRAGQIPARRAGDRWIISRRRVRVWLDGDDQADTLAEATAGGGAR